MAVGFDASSESHTGTSGSASETSFSWSHAGGTPKGVLVFVFNTSDDVDLVSGVTYGGQSVPAVTGGEQGIASGESGFVKTYFLGSGVPSGTQTVEVSRTNNTNVLYAVAVTVTAGANTEVYESGIILTSSTSATQAEQNVDDGSPGTDSLRFAGTYTGYNFLTGNAGSNSTDLQWIDLGVNGCSVVRETTAGQGSRPVGFTISATDDVATVHLAVREVVVGGTSVEPGTGVLAMSGHAPSVVQDTRVSPSTGALTISGYTPTVEQPIAVNPGAGDVTIAGHAPSVVQNTQIGPGPGTLTITGHAPMIIVGTAVNPGAGILAITGHAPTVEQPLAIAPGAGILAIIGYAPMVTQVVPSRVVPDLSFGAVPVAWQVDPGVASAYSWYQEGTSVAMRAEIPDMPLQFEWPTGWVYDPGYAATYSWEQLGTPVEIRTTGIVPVIEDPVAQVPVDAPLAWRVDPGYTGAYSWYQDGVNVHTRSGTERALVANCDGQVQYGGSVSVAASGFVSSDMLLGVQADAIVALLARSATVQTDGVVKHGGSLTTSVNAVVVAAERVVFTSVDAIVRGRVTRSVQVSAFVQSATPPQPGIAGRVIVPFESNRIIVI